MVAPKRYVHLEPENVSNLEKKRVLVDGIKVRTQDHRGLSGWALRRRVLIINSQDTNKRKDTEEKVM